ncbi:peptidase M75 [Saccharobesus litoralis]|uniref:Peptidase M75 n=1 Tax=Saccharobesus litoralis TaxID=2172099 RepID=A0A2S0VSX9_9ALTE|nr:imelysin family protein [Saccharobesus litoralis]AWB67326.1 peptidase M75 [Saccharobesus litoralis]
MRLQYTALACALLIGTLSGCGESSSSQCGDGFPNCNKTDNTTQFDEKALVSHLVDRIIVPQHNAFAASLAPLESAVDQYCQALQADTVTNELNLAQAAWRSTATEWQKIEMYQLTPLSQDTQALRNLFYSWPSVSTCGVDQDTVFNDAGMINTTPYDISKRSVSRRGIPALEYTLFNSDLDHSCSSNSGAVANWNSRTDASRTLARCKYAQTLVDDIKVSQQTFANIWQGDNGYASQLKNAGQPGSDFTSVHQAVNVISDALFYLDSFVKDKKLGEPLGYFGTPTNVESPYSETSLQNISANLQAFYQLYMGDHFGSASPLGFHHFLIEEGETETAQNILTNIQAAQNRVANMQSSLKAQLNADQSDLEALHADIKKVTDDLKTLFITTLALELPSTSAGDND